MAQAFSTVVVLSLFIFALLLIPYWQGLSMLIISFYQGLSLSIIYYLDVMFKSKFPQTLLPINAYLVSRRQEQHSTRIFAVAFLKMLTLYMLRRTQFLSEFYAVFVIMRSWSCRDYKLKFWTSGCPKKSEYSFHFWQ